MLERLEKYKADLEAAKKKRAWWDNRIKELEKKCQEEEKTAVHDIPVETIVENTEETEDEE